MNTKLELLDALGEALDEDSFERLAELRPAIAKAISEAIRKGLTPGHVHGYVLDRTDSKEMARWCLQAARHLQTQRGD